MVAAANRLRMNNTTVARRVAALERELGVRLVERGRSGRLVLTRAGEIAVRQAEIVERELAALEQDISGGDAAISGVVRLTAVPLLVNRLLAPNAGRILRDHPGLELELIGEPRNLSLTRREADVAVRLARPEDGGLRVKGRRIGLLEYAVYAARELVRQNRTEELPWLSYDEAHAHLPQAVWMAAAYGVRSNMRLGDGEAIAEAAAVGAGRTLLPTLIGDRDPRLQRVDMLEVHAPLPQREIWLLVHNDLSGLARIHAVIDWLEALFR